MVLQRQEEFWPEADKFKPERWFVNGDRSKRQYPKPFTFTPFNAGVRSCIGKNFALMETQVGQEAGETVSGVVANFDCLRHGSWPGCPGAALLSLHLQAVTWAEDSAQAQDYHETTPSAPYER